MNRVESIEAEKILVLWIWFIYIRIKLNVMRSEEGCRLLTRTAKPIKSGDEICPIPWMRFPQLRRKSGNELPVSLHQLKNLKVETFFRSECLIMQKFR